MTTIEQLRTAIQSCEGLSPAWKEAIEGLVDAACVDEGEAIAESPLGPLKQVFASIELPGTETPRMYIKLAPFDVSIKREQEGLVVDIFASGEDAPLEPIASTYAFESDAIEAD